MKHITLNAMVVFCGLVIASQTEASQPAGKAPDVKVEAKAIQSFMPQSPDVAEAPQQVGGGGIAQFCMRPGTTPQAYYAAVNDALGRSIGWEPVQFMQTINNNVLCTVILLKRVSAK